MLLRFYIQVRKLHLKCTYICNKSVHFLTSFWFQILIIHWVLWLAVLCTSSDFSLGGTSGATSGRKVRKVRQVHELIHGGYAAISIPADTLRGWHLEHRSLARTKARMSRMPGIAVARKVAEGVEGHGRNERQRGGDWKGGGGVRCT